MQPPLPEEVKLTEQEARIAAELDKLFGGSEPASPSPSEEP
jgi:hypothetical protein